MIWAVSDAGDSQRGRPAGEKALGLLQLALVQRHLRLGQLHQLIGPRHLLRGGLRRLIGATGLGRQFIDILPHPRQRRFRARRFAGQRLNGGLARQRDDSGLLQHRHERFHAGRRPGPFAGTFLMLAVPHTGLQPPQPLQQLPFICRDLRR